MILTFSVVTLVVVMLSNIGVMHDDNMWGFVHIEQLCLCFCFVVVGVV
jgi:hypothetical protein